VNELGIDFGAVPLPWRVLTFLALGVATHVAVLLIKRTAIRFARRTTRLRLKKLQSLTTLLSSAAVFVLYFLLIGLLLKELGVRSTRRLIRTSTWSMAGTGCRLLFLAGGVID
jgi:hypothetical protein